MIFSIVNKTDQELMKHKVGLNYDNSLYDKCSWIQGTSKRDPKQCQNGGTLCVVVFVRSDKCSWIQGTSNRDTKQRQNGGRRNTVCGCFCAVGVQDKNERYGQVFQIKTICVNTLTRKGCRHYRMCLQTLSFRHRLIS
jgi:hypothetical protein